MVQISYFEHLAALMFSEAEPFMQVYEISGGA